MKLKKCLWACLLVVASGSAFAMDPDDEDASYLPQHLLQDYFSSSLKYGYDKTHFMNCLAGGGAEKMDKAEQRKFEDSCRSKATPRKCREHSAIPTHEKAQSSQEVCAATCKKNSGDAECALN